jgi:hypothetical protein
VDKNNLSLEEQLKQGLIEPGQPIPFKQTIELQFQDGQLDALKEQSKKIILTEAAGSKGKKPKLNVVVEGIHTGMTKNMTFYPGNALEESVPTWTEPHRKPVLKNHNSYTEPLGRITSAEYVPSTLTDKYTVRLGLEVTDPDAIEKIMDGRYLTLSVGGSAQRVTCSVCGKDLVQEGWCGHSRGRTYEGKKAHWTIGNYTGDEISFVNMPADVHSQVIQAELVNGEGGKNVGKNGEAQNDDQTAVKTTESETDLIDGLLDGNGVNSDTGKATTENTDDNPNPEGDASKQNENNDNPTGDEETLEEKVTRLEGELQQTKSDLEAAQNENVNLAAERDQLKTDLADANTQKESAEAERDTFKEQNIKLARFSRRSMAERVVDLRILQGKDNADERDALVEQWVGSSSKVLESQIKDLLESGRRTIVTVQNPGAAVPENNTQSVIVDENNNEIDTAVHTKESKTDKPKIRTLKDLSEGMTKYMARNY